MPDDYFRLSKEDRGEALGFAASHSGRPPHLLEKDIWVVWTLGILFGAPVGDHLTFKGGTSLSKAYHAIRRFSEDIDLTFDIRRLVPDLAGEEGDALPQTASEQRTWTRAVRKRLPDWVSGEMLPLVEEALMREQLPARARVEGDKIFVEYEPLMGPSAYTPPRVMLEFGARSTGEPSDRHEVTCDAADVLEGIAFPTARPRVMRAERTFWEKATAVHVFCSEGPLRGERISRHWHDLARLDEVGIASAAMTDRALARAVAEHKSWFFVEKNADREPIDYHAAVSGGLRLVPQGRAREMLAEDYGNMVEDGLLLDEAEPFDELMDRARALEDRTNAAA
jgi:hypothetical protein